MGRKMRVEYKNGIFHVIQRGDNRGFENVRTIGKSEDNPEINASYRKGIRKSLDEILLASGVNEKEFELIKNRSGKRSLAGYKLVYARETLEVNYISKEIGKNTKIFDEAIVDMLKRNNLVNLCQRRYVPPPFL